MWDFEITASFTPPLAVITLKGELDISTADSIGWGVGQALERGCTLVGVDLVDVSFIDCSGIDALAEALQRLEATSAYLWINGLSPEVGRIMKLTRTDALFGVSDLVPEGCPQHPWVGA